MAFPGYADPIDVEALKVGVQEIVDAATNAARSSAPLATTTGWGTVGSSDNVTKTGPIASFRGTIQRTGANLSITSSWVKIATVPTGFRPEDEQVRMAQTNSGLIFQFQIATNGDVSVRSSAATQTWLSTATLPLTGIGTWAVAA